MKLSSYLPKLYFSVNKISFHLLTCEKNELLFFLFKKKIDQGDESHMEES